MVGVASKERGFAAGFADGGADATVCAFVVWLGAVDEDPKENGEAADPAGAGAGAVNEKAAAAGAALSCGAAVFAESAAAPGVADLVAPKRPPVAGAKENGADAAGTAPPGWPNVNGAAAGVAAVCPFCFVVAPVVAGVAHPNEKTFNPPVVAGWVVLAVSFAGVGLKANGLSFAGAGADPVAVLVAPKENPPAAGVAVVDAGVVVLVVPKENAPPAGAGAAGVAVAGVAVLGVPKENTLGAAAAGVAAGVTTCALVVLLGVAGEDPNENGDADDADVALVGAVTAVAAGAPNKGAFHEGPGKDGKAEGAGVALVGAVTAGGVDGPNMDAPNENIFVALSAGAGAKMDETGAAGWPSEKTGSAVGVGAVLNKKDPVDVSKENGDALVVESGKRDLELDKLAEESVQMLREQTERRNPYNNEKKTYLRPLHVN